MNEDINLQIIDFPVGSHSHETVTRNEDGSYTIFLNARDAFNIQQQAYVHALKHIKDGDLTSDKDVQVIEAQQHGLTPKPSKKPKKPKKRKKTEWEKYHAKMLRKEKALAKMGLQMDPYIADDDYGCSTIKYKITSMR